MKEQTDWHGKPYYSLDAFCKNTYGRKLYKIALDAGLTCPNRDGTLDTRGCLFCSAGGSGDFAAPLLSEGAQLINRKLNIHDLSAAANVSTAPYIAYFQAFTNTYGPVSYLSTIYRAALEEPSVAGISIATRPDCLGDEILQLLAALQKEYPEKFIWIELGLQTIHEETAAFIRRGYPLTVFEQAIDALAKLAIPVIVHIVLGLPGEKQAMIDQTIQALNQWQEQGKLQGVKLQLLHVLRDTDLATLYTDGAYEPLTFDAYLQLLIHCIELLSPEIVLHRVTGDAPKKLLLAPTWSANKRLVLNTLHQTMKQQNSCQGKQYVKKTNTLS